MYEGSLNVRRLILHLVPILCLERQDVDIVLLRLRSVGQKLDLGHGGGPMARQAHFGKKKYFIGNPSILPLLGAREMLENVPFSPPACMHDIPPRRSKEGSGDVGS